jgi:DeoR/GlpR family transcriptional regulator of sugar metabolism
VEDIDVLVTDKGAPDELTESFTAAGVEVIRA